MQPTPETCRSGAWNPLPLAIIAALTGYAIFLFAPQVLNDGDTYQHITAGEWFLQHRAIPLVDPFSYSFAGAPWVAHEWLSELLMALAFRAGGWDGILILFGAALALTLGMMTWHLSRWLDFLPTLVLLILGAACTSPSLLARPHILVLPVLELWTAGLLLARSRGGAPSPLLLPLMLLWANMHGSFAFGLALTLPLALEAAAEAERSALRGWGLFMVAAVIAALATPHFWRGLLFPFQLMQMQQLSHVGEWQAPDFQHLQPIELGLMALLYVTLSRGIRLPVPRVLILMGLLHLALQHLRHQSLAELVGALVLAEPLGRAFAQASGPPAVLPRRNRPRAVAAGLAVVLALTGLRVAFPAARTDDAASPVSALAHVPAEIARLPVFNDYSFGGYLIFKGVRPFIDPRADMYGDAFLAAYGAVVLRPRREGFETMAEKYGVRWTILSAGSPLLGVLDAMPGWRRLYADRVAVVHVRTDAGP